MNIQNKEENKEWREEGKEKEREGGRDKMRECKRVRKLEDFVLWGIATDCLLASLAPFTIQVRGKQRMGRSPHLLGCLHDPIPFTVEWHRNMTSVSTPQWKPEPINKSNFVLVSF